MIASKPPTINKKVATLHLWIHDERFSKQDVILQPDCFPGIKVGDCIELCHAQEHGNAKVCLQIQPNTIDKELLLKQPQLQISISQAIATQFEFINRRDVIARKIDEHSIGVDFIEFVFRDQYIGRADMWRLKLMLIGTVVYVGKRISTLGIRGVQIKNIFVNGMSSHSGLVNEKTRMIFRSETAKYFIFIQMSREMWDFDEDGDMYFEKCIHGFLPDLFSKWKSFGCNHVVSIILFTRIFYDSEENNGDLFASNLHGSPMDDGSAFPISMDAYGRYYRDFYRVVIDWETRLDWTQVLIPIKKEFLKFQQNVLEGIHLSGSELCGTNSHASEGNVLEAINLALNPFDKHYIDRDFQRTGLSIVVITPGVGSFEVDRKLCRLTNQRMIDNGIALDLVCLSKPPLYTTPLFQFLAPQVKKSFDKEKMDVSDPLYFDDMSTSSPKLYYWIPHWIDCSFWSRDGDRIKIFTPRCKLSDHHGIGTSSESSILMIPPLDNVNATVYDQKNERDAYDELVFDSKLLHAEKYAKGSSIGSDTYQTESSNESHRLNDANKISSISPDFSFATAHSLSHFLRSHDVTLKSDIEMLFKAPIAESGDLSKPEDRATFLKLRQAFGQSKEVTMKSSKSNSILSSNFFNPHKSPEQDIKNERRRSTHFSGIKTMDTMSDDAFTTHASIDPIKIDSHGKHLLEAGRELRSSFSGSFRNSPTDVSKLMMRQSPGKLTMALSRPAIRQNYINPCNPSKNIIRLSSHIRRWQHIYPKLAQTKHESTDWKSLCTPACLPITTDFFPTHDELRDFYQEYTYTVSPADDSFDELLNEQQKVEALLTELISQRLAQGFQLITEIVDGKPKGLASGMDASNHATDDSGKRCHPLPNSYFLGQSRRGISISKPHYLSLGDHIHRLYYDQSGKNVEVKRYVRKVGYDTSSISYTCAIWPCHIQFYHSKTFNFNYPTLANYNWNYLDHLISGYQDEMTDALRFWRTRYLLIPMEGAPTTHNTSLNPSNEILDEEESRLAGFGKFIDVFEKARFTHPKSRITKGSTQDRRIHVTLTTLNASAHVKSEYERNFSHKEDMKATQLLSRERLVKSTPLDVIAASMQQPNGVAFKDRRWHFRLYEKVFIGSECVDWILREFSDIDTREDAVIFGTELLKRNFFEHVNSSHGFLDGHYFYRLNKEFIKQEGNSNKTLQLGWFRIKSGQFEVSSIGQEEANHPMHSDQMPFVMTKRLVVEMDPQHISQRREMAILHIDTLHNPKNCFHFQIHWLMCTARLIETMIQAWSRTAEKCGLKLIEAPIGQAIPYSDDNPFQSIIPIRFKVSPPVLSSDPSNIVPEQWFERELLKKFNFILDVESDDFMQSVEYSYARTPYRHTQYIHRHGIAILQILPKGQGFLWTNNRLHLTASNHLRTQASLNPDIVRDELTQFCDDPIQLQEFWIESQKRISSIQKFKELPELNELERQTLLELI